MAAVLQQRCGSSPQPSHPPSVASLQDLSCPRREHLPTYVPVAPSPAAAPHAKLPSAYVRRATVRAVPPEQESDLHPGPRQTASHAAQPLTGRSAPSLLSESN